MTDSALVRLEVDGGIGTIRLDRPPMNALNVQVQEELRAVAKEAGDRSDVSAVVLYGGEKVFAAGADIKEMATMAYADMVARSGPLQTSFTAVARIPKPVVAAVTGYALGGGCELALCADFRVCAENARLGQPEIQLGLIPGAARAMAARFVGGPALALRAAKEAVDGGLETDLTSGLALERLQFAGLFATDDGRAGMASFVTDGPGKASFTGR